MVKRYANPDMKPGHSLLPWIVSLLFTLNAAATRYVDVNNTNATFPYTSWATAATNIQQAVDIAQTSEVILVTNGIYSSGGRLFGGSSNRVAIDGKVLTIQSVNGPGVTFIKGFQIPGTNNGPSAVRCVYLSSGSLLSGFTLTDGATAISEVGAIFADCLQLAASLLRSLGSGIRQERWGRRPGSLWGEPVAGRGTGAHH